MGEQETQLQEEYRMRSQDNQGVLPVMAHQGHTGQGLACPKKRQNRQERQQVEFPVLRQYLVVEIEEITVQIDGYCRQQQCQHAITVPS